jgi:hypothetical protein
MFWTMPALVVRAQQQLQPPFFYQPFWWEHVTHLPPFGLQVNQPEPLSMTEESRSIHSRALPNYERAEIPRSKIEGYVLNPAHDEGMHKARVFKSALGFDQSNWERLKQSILDELPYHEAKPAPTSQWGDAYVVDLPIEGPNGNTAKVLTVWLFKTGMDFPSLITVYVLPKRK